MKAIHIYLISLFIITLIPLKSMTQNSAIADFTIQSSDFSYDNESTGISSVLSKTGNTLTWIQNNEQNTLTTTFNIIETNGVWDNNTSIGDITMTLDDKGSTSTISLTGTNDTVSLIIHVFGLNNTTETIIFEVSTLTYL